jgi:hypothetical protein
VCVCVCMSALTLYTCAYREYMCAFVFCSFVVLLFFRQCCGFSDGLYLSPPPPPSSFSHTHTTHTQMNAHALTNTISLTHLDTHTQTVVAPTLLRRYDQSSPFAAAAVTAMAAKAAVALTLWGDEATVAAAACR